MSADRDIDEEAVLSDERSGCAGQDTLRLGTPGMGKAILDFVWLPKALISQRI